MILIIFSVALAVYVIAYAMVRISGRSTPAPAFRTNVSKDYYRRACAVAGGRYVGIQHCTDTQRSEGLPSFVLFNSLKTGSTLALKENEFSATAVRERLKTHEAEWGIT